jgi:hypothetical protein
MSESILNSIKKILGLSEDYLVFDPDIILHINSAFGTLNQLGIGPVEGFAIEDDTATWADFLGTDLRLNAVKQYIGLKVRIVFDPPDTSYYLAAMEKQIQEHEWRLNVVREGDSWVDPDPDLPTTTE